MKDISDDTSKDIQIVNTQAHKAKNVLTTQIGSLEYAKDIGLDFDFFFQNGLRFQNESFQSYAISVLSQNEINVASLIIENGSLFETYLFNLAKDDDSSSFLTR